MKDVFNEGIPFITHFVFRHPFLRRLQFLSTFIKHLTLVDSKLIKQKY